VIPLRDHLPTRRIAFVNYFILFANVAMFVLERTLLAKGVSPTRLMLTWGLVPVRFLHAPSHYAANVLTSMFTHDPSNWAHIGFNMLFLWIFGDNVEDAMGHLRYAAFYLLAGAAAAGAQVAVGPDSAVPMIGASGAIAGVLAAYASLYPWSPITVLNPFCILWLFFGIFVELPAWFVVGLFFVVNVLDAFHSLGTVDSGGVAFFAHIGGFVAGLILVPFFVPTEPRRQPPRWSGWRPPPERRKPWSNRRVANGYRD
jgi:membrane associated rhomboid family serine protease